MGRNPGFAELVSIPSRRTSVWYESAISSFLARRESRRSRKLVVRWDKLLGMGTLLMVCGTAWTAVGFAFAHFLW
jgi:hypothetical protein